jgi:hypothetical protein
MLLQDPSAERNGEDGHGEVAASAHTSKGNQSASKEGPLPTCFLVPFDITNPLE